ncbi:MAG TPA: ABC transporter ATP-binding protein [Arcobacter sp.]|nr:ABC transporter ATP-binding protein [Arcobacter sp.]HIP55869.1 ABC transporter ATP-binding protein [Arcobacter sp.]
MTNSNSIPQNPINKLLLEAKNISHNFDYPLFENINLSLSENETIAIIGASGCGKSTLLNIFCSLLKPLSGEIYFKEKNIFEISQSEMLKLRRDDFGIIFQAHYLFRGFSANENLHIAELLSENNVSEDLMKALDISHVLTQGIGELSGGQQQRLSIARVLTKSPKIIFADEPTGNLDQNTASEVMKVMFEYVSKQNAGMILVTHDEKIAYSCDKVYKLINQQLERVK